MNYLEFFYGPEQQRYDGHGEGERCCSESERDDGYVEDCRQDMNGCGHQEYRPDHGCRPPERPDHDCCPP